MKSMKNYNVIFGITLTFIFLALSIYNINFGLVLDYIQKVDVRFVILASLLYISAFIFRAFRWKFIIKKKKNVPFKSSFSYVVIGWMGNNIFPARAGEVLRAYVTGRKERLGTTFSLATIIAERLFDVLALASMLFIVTLFSPFPGWVHEIIIYSSILLAAAIAGIFIVIKTGGWPLKNISAIKDKIDSFIEGFRIIEPKSYIPIFIFSILAWLTESLVFFSMGIAFGLNIGIFAAIFALLVVNLGIVIPSSPGYVGTFHFFCILALGVFSIGRDTALGFAILVHLAEYIPTTVAGLYLLRKEGIKLTDFRKK